MSARHVAGRSPGRARQRGVTLVELVAVLVIVGVVMSIGARLFVQPVSALISGGRNVVLGDQAAQATRRLEDDLSSALGNSVRVTTGTVGGLTASFVELVPVQTVGRYRKYVALRSREPNRSDGIARSVRSRSLRGVLAGAC